MSASGAVPFLSLAYGTVGIPVAAPGESSRGARGLAARLRTKRAAHHDRRTGGSSASPMGSALSRPRSAVGGRVPKEKKQTSDPERSICRSGMPLQLGQDVRAIRGRARASARHTLTTGYDHRGCSRGRSRRPTHDARTPPKWRTLDRYRLSAGRPNQSQGGILAESGRILLEALGSKNWTSRLLQ